MNSEERLHWLLDGDVSIQYQTHRDLLGEDRPDLRARMATEGWGTQIHHAHRQGDHPDRRAIFFDEDQNGILKTRWMPTRRVEPSCFEGVIGV